jgi:glycosyltransferase involved in cell wall biosynthesis
MNEYGYNKWPYKTKRINPIHCGFSVKRFGFQTKFYDKIRTELNLLANMKICLFLGRIGLQSYDKAPNQKNPEFAFEIAKVLCDIDPEWVVLFVGSKGMFGETLEQEVLISRLGGNIRFLGVRNDVEALLSASDVLLFPSKWEGLGMVVVEAQASNLPVIMSTGLPSESVVIPKLVKQLELKQSPAFWAQQILTFNRRTINCDLEESKIKIQQSPFSIENSIQRIFMVAQS